uniref:Variant surface glycoprotein 1125.328 n=1 Tax=Trypanosoma brucei TaxID=5691 RepID=A0A1J0R5Q6_9TRYP|nr:variant surface glycoprotein 1125.328 [Trypanosoma brucei]
MTNFYALEAIALFTTAYTVHAASPGFDDAGDLATDLCGEARYNLGLTQIFESETDQIETAIAKAVHRQAALNIAAAATSNPTLALALTALAELQGQMLSTGAQPALTALKAKQKAAAMLKVRLARLADLKAMKIQTLDAGKASTINDAGTWPVAGIKSTTADFTPKGIEAENCSLNDLEDAKGQKKSQIQHTTITKLKLVPEAVFAQSKIKITAAYHGSPASGPATDMDKVSGIASQSITVCATSCLEAKAEVDELAFKTEPVGLFAKAGERGACKEHKTAAKWHQLSTEATLDAICQATTSTFNERNLLLQLTYDSLKNNQQLAKIILLLRRTNDKDGDAAESKAADIVPAVIGSDPSSFDTNIIKFVTQTEHTFTVRGNEIKGTLLKLAVSTSSADILAHLKGEAAKESKIASTQAPVTTKKGSDKCTAITDKAKCKSEDGCKYNEKDNECENIPAKSLEGTTKTNTTGSNSFVIQKAPLLLAFFIK